MADMYRAKEPFAFTSKGGLPRIITAGFVMFSDDPDFKGKEHLFEPVEAAAIRGRRVRAGDASAVDATETATAAPGERRDVTRGPGRPRKMVSASLPTKADEKEKDNG